MSDASSSFSRSVQSLKDNGLVVEGPPWGLEKIYDYEEGGHHPLHLQDLLHDRYRVIHKLGSGGYANVWLCIDVSRSSPEYVAVKVIMAEGSTADCPEARVIKVVEAGCDQEEASMYLSLPLDQFQIHGPNGTHYAFVYPVLGPRVSRLSHLAKLDDPGPALRKVCLDATQALAILHKHEICHGDFRPANILSRVWGLDGLPEEELLQMLGVPKTTPVVTESGESHSLQSAPDYLVYPVNWDDVLAKGTEPSLQTGSACLTDFGESFYMGDPPPEVGIPQVYCSPEQALEQKVGRGSDLWALGCTLFEIRTGRKLFDTFDDDVDECLYTIATILGKFPEPWWSDTWEARKNFFEDDAGASGEVVDVCKESSLQGNGQAQGKGESNAFMVVYERAKPRSLEEAILRGLVYESNRGPQGIQRDIPTGEAKVFANLLAQLLKYNPEDRIPASRVLEHDWFRLGT